MGSVRSVASKGILKNCVVSRDEYFLKLLSSISEFPWVVDPEENFHGKRFDNVTIDISRCEWLLKEPLDEDESAGEARGSIPRDTSAPLYSGSSITIMESLASILSFVQCEHLSGAGLGRLLSLISLHLPKPNKFFESKYNLLKLLETLDDPVEIHYFCSNCYKIRSSQDDLCDRCTEETRTVCYFIKFPLLPQLAAMFKRPEFVEALKYRFNRKKQNDDNIEDLYDCQTYLEAVTRFLKTIFDISFMWNWDGLQIFKSNTFSLWPFYLIINELPPEMRFKSENILIAGLWGCVTKPHPNLFLLPIYKDLQMLKAGVVMEVHGEQEKQIVHAECISGSCDSPARATIFNQKLHSGFYSCPICKIRGQKPEDTTVFPYEENSPLRNMTEYQQHVDLAVKHKIIVIKNQAIEEQCFGIKGPTVLSSLVPDMFACTAIDSMHAIYLGVMRQMMHLWFDPDYQKEPFSLFRKINIVNARLKKLNLPHFLERLPLNVSDIIHWKASQFRTFLFYLSLCVLSNDVMNEKYFKHYLLFVHGTSICNSSSISKNDLNFADLLLHQFVREFSDLYGLNFMSHNLHLLLHLVKTVLSLGPLWATSCFMFEDLNGRLSNFIHGTRHVGLQVYSNLSIITKLPLIVRSIKNEAAKQFCTHISKRFRLKLTEKISPGFYCVGVFTPLKDNTLWIHTELLDRKIVTPVCSFVLFHRLLKERLLYVSSMYERGVRDSSCVKYKSGDSFRTGMIHCFVKFNCNCSSHPKYMCVVQPFKTKQAFDTHYVPLGYISKLDAEPFETLVDFPDASNLCSVLFQNEVDGTVYLCEPLNRQELE